MSDKKKKNASDPKKFIAELYPAARQVSKETGMSWELILAQAAGETGWGAHVLPGTNNIFNIKTGGGWTGPSKSFNVWEVENGKKVWKMQPFRVYGSYHEALADRIAFLQGNKRYKKAGMFDEGTKGDLRKEAAALQKAGYATDPHYADKLVTLFNGPTMQAALKYAQGQAPAASSAPAGTGRQAAPAAAPVPAAAAGAPMAATAKASPAAAAPAPHPAAPHLSAPAPSLLKQGIHNDAVRNLQWSLARQGYQVKIDGYFGPGTKTAVEAYQRAHGLQVDGVVGPTTLQQLNAHGTKGSATLRRTDGESPMMQLVHLFFG
jgi:hypothetical protein